MGGASKSESESTQTSQSFVDPRQVPFLDQLRQLGLNLAQGQTSQIGSVASQLSGQLGGIGGQLLGGIQGQAGQFAPGAASAISGLLGIAQDPLAGTSQLEQLAAGGGALSGLSGPGSQLGGQLTALDEAIQRNLQSTLGSIGGQATLQGQVGGDRQAFFSSEAGGEAQRAFASGASDLLASDLAQRRQLAGVSLGAAQSLQQGDVARGGLLAAAGGLGLTQQGQNIGAGQAGLGSLTDLFNLGLAPFAAEFAPLLALAQIIGAPTVLQTQTGQSTGSSAGFQILGDAPSTTINT